MSTKFKRIYVEITSSCNLNCSFCQETKRAKTFLTVEQFRHIIHEIRPYTGYIYLHVKGEPLLHPQLDQFLAICEAANIRVNITTNGTLLKKMLPVLITHPVHQINISMHSADDNTCIELNQYYGELFYFLEEITEKTKTEISLRLWATLKDPFLFGEKNIRLRDRIHINVQSKFDWPDLKNDYYNERGFCQGLRTHIAILSDGTVVPCCLDGNGCMKLGNIFTDSLDNILNSERATAFITGFRNKYAIEPLCRHCSFKERFGNHL